MRKQYHLKKSDKDKNKVIAWDIDNLISLTKSIKEEKIPLNAIKELVETFWYKFGETPTCKSIALHIKLINECNLEYPIIIYSDGELLDGMHRVLKAFLNNQKYIMAYRLKTMQKPDFKHISIDDLPYNNE